MSEKEAKRPARRWLVRVGVVCVVLVVFYVLVRFAFQFWNLSLPADAPRIAFSLDDTWIGQIGVTDTTYQQAMTRAGGRLITVRPDAAGSPKVEPELIETLLDEKKIDGLLLTGGGDVDPDIYGGDTDKTMLLHRLRDDFEIALIRAARARNLPILGVCRGCQILNVAFGGTLRNLRLEEELKESHFTFKGHPVELVPDSTLAKLLGVTRLDNAYSLHGQAADKPGTGVTVVATGPGDVVEAIEVDAENEESWIMAVQWHPEMAVTDAAQNKVFNAFVERARKARQQRLSVTARQ